jgi:hypothetical protein
MALLDDNLFGVALLEKCIYEEPQRVCDLLTMVAKYPLDDFIGLYKMLDDDHYQAIHRTLSKVAMEFPDLFLKFLSQLLSFGNEKVHRLYVEGILCAEPFHLDLSSDLDRLRTAFQSIEFFGIDGFFDLCNRLKACGLFNVSTMIYTPFQRVSLFCFSRG